MKNMLINANNQDELRVALIEGKKLYDLDIEFLNQQQITANIYKARVSRIEPSLDAAFIDYKGKNERQGFLARKEVALEHYPNHVKSDKLGIQDILHEGQSILVQVEKEERGNKGAALTTIISLAGCYLVLMPNNPNAGGISRRIEGNDREKTRNILEELQIPPDMSVIVRTAGVNKTIEELKWDLDSLLNIWNAIKTFHKQSNSTPTLVHQESDTVIRAIRDYLSPKVNKIIIDSPETYERVKNYIGHIRPEYTNKLELHQEKTPLFSYYRIESQIEAIFQREVALPSGGVIVIDHTEALIAIDVNSARFTTGNDIEDTALRINLEAVEMIAKLLRWLDLGGLIVIDLIDMNLLRNKRLVENSFRQSLNNDRARIQIGNISRFGLLEMSRQRLRPSLRNIQQIICPNCHGHGTIRSITSFSSYLLRLTEEKALEDNTAQIQLQISTEVATYLFNEKRSSIVNIEKHYNITLTVLANPHFRTIEYDIKIITIHEFATSSLKPPSYKMITPPNIDDYVLKNEKEIKPCKAKVEEPVIKVEISQKPAPIKIDKKVQSGNFLQRFLKTIFGSHEKDSANDSNEIVTIKKTTPTRSQKTTNNNRHRTRKTRTSNRNNIRRRTNKQEMPTEEKKTTNTTKNNRTKRKTHSRTTRTHNHRTRQKTTTTKPYPLTNKLDKSDTNVAFNLDQPKKTTRTPPPSYPIKQPEVKIGAPNAGVNATAKSISFNDKSKKKKALPVVEKSSLLDTQNTLTQVETKQKMETTISKKEEKK